MAETAHRAPRPNVIWFVCDQLRWDTLGFYGDAVARTPNLDRLAAAGTVFENMFVQSPVCMTSRACMFTGRYLQNLSMANGCAILDPWETTLPTRLQQAGWRTGHFGKLHLTPQQYTQSDLHEDVPVTDPERFWFDAGMRAPMPADPARRHYGFQEEVGLEDALFGNYLPWLIERAPDLAERMPVDRWRAGEIPARRCCDALRTTDFPDGPLKDVGTTAIPGELHGSMFIAEAAADFFERHHAEQPCFLHVSFVDPHHPWDPPADIAAHYDIDAMPLPEHRENAIDWPPSLRERAFDFSGVTDRMARTVVAYNYAMLEVVDNAVGRVVDAVERSSELQNTVFCFCCDHGELLGAYGLWRKGSYHYDAMIKTPAFIAWPGTLPAGERVSGLRQSIDLAPTLLSLCGLDPHEGMQGDDLADALRRGEVPGRDWTYTEMYTAWWGPFVACWTLRTPEAKLNLYPQDRVGHLFDLRADPDETQDLWHSPDHRALRDDMLLLLLQSRHEQTDPLPRVLSQY